MVLSQLELIFIGSLGGGVLVAAISVALLSARTKAGRKKLVSADLTAGNVEVNAMHLDAIFGSLADGVLTIDKKGCVQAINPVAERIFGCSADHVVGKAVASILPDSTDLTATGDLVTSIQNVPAGAWRECHVSRADGMPLTLQISVSHVAPEGCNLTVVVLRDVSVPRQIAAVDALVHEVNQRVLQGEDMEFLTPFLCRRIMGLFNLRLVWIAGTRPDGSFSVLGFAGPSAVERHFNSMNLRWDGERREPAALAILSGDIQRTGPTVPDWLEPQEEGRSPLEGVSIPLRVGKTVLGAMTAYADARIAAALMPRLENLAEHLGFVLQVMSDQRRLLLQGAAIGAAANAIFITNGSGCIQWVNDAFTRLSGYGLDEAVGRSPSLLHSGVQTKQVYQDLWSTIHAGEVWRGELVERRKDGTLYTVEQTVTPMRDHKGAVSHFVVVHEDITDRKYAEERIRFLSNFDAMTGLPNRGLFRERLILALSRADDARKTIAILFLDLDHFSRINDTMGHDLGDRLLEKIVDRLTAVTRSADTLARVGGDEFAVILEEQADSATVVILARRLLNAISRPYDIDGHEIHLGASVGISFYPADAKDADQLIQNADRAMYHAIHEAPNGYRFFSSAMNDETQARNDLERDLRRAIGRDEFVLHYQPQKDVLTGALVGLEALVRWNHPERGLIFPGDFIAAAEETGLIVPLGELVLRQACGQIRIWLEAGLNIVPVAVNLSALQLHRDGLVEGIQDIVYECGITPEWLEIELTESSVMTDAEAAERTLRALDAFGIRLAIDDFGTGYSSLSYLKRFPVSKLKIDRSFVASLADESSNDAAITRAIITLGHSLGMRVLAEGVETERQLAYLRRQGCDAMQGFLYSRPVPPKDVPPLLAVERFRDFEH